MHSHQYAVGRALSQLSACSAQLPLLCILHGWDAGSCIVIRRHAGPNAASAADSPLEKSVMSFAYASMLSRGIREKRSLICRRKRVGPILCSPVKRPMIWVTPPDYDGNTNSARLSWHNVVDQLNKKRTIAMMSPSENTASFSSSISWFVVLSRATTIENPSFFAIESLFENSSSDEQHDLLLRKPAALFLVSYGFQHVPSIDDERSVP